MPKKKGKTEAPEPAPAVDAAAMQAISRALADPRRTEVLRMIATCSATSCMDVRQRLRMSPATLSHHVKQLENAGLIETVRDGKLVRAHLRRKVWKSYLAYLKQLTV